MKYLTAPGKLEMIAKASFPRVNIPNFRSEDSIIGRFVDDYPIPSSATTTTTPTASSMISPLLYAIMRQSFDMCKFLIKTIGFDVNTSDSSGASALVYAIRVNNFNLCNLLMNTDYEPVKTIAKAKTAVAQLNKAGYRMNNLFTSILPTETTSKPAKAAKTDGSEADEESGGEEMSGEEDETPMEIDQFVSTPVDKSSSPVRIKTNLMLNQLDEKSRTIFHHLACSLDYGSFRNSELARLFFSAFQYANEHQPNLKLPPLSDFLKRVDSKVKSASDYALKNGNIELYEEFKKQLLKSAPPPQISSNELEKFTVTDPFYNSSVKVDFLQDSEAFLRSHQSVPNSDPAIVDKVRFCPLN